MNDYSPAGRPGGLGTFGLIAVLVVVALKFRALEVLGEARQVGLLLAPVLGRWAMAILAYGARDTNRRDQEIFWNVGAKSVFLATFITLALIVFFSGRLGLWIALWISLFALGARKWLEKSLGGLSRDNLDAAVELSEAFALTIFATF